MFIHRKLLVKSALFTTLKMFEIFSFFSGSIPSFGFNQIGESYEPAMDFDDFSTLVNEENVLETKTKEDI